MFIASINALREKPRALSKWLRPMTAVGLLCASMFGFSLSWGSPEEIQEVNQLLASGKVDEAARVVQKALRQNANDVQMRFLQGVVAVEQKKYDQAIYVFTGLARDYPSLPEPYNNLAVLYAAKGDDRRAAQVLEQAIRTNPSYATAHQNLGDLYARMANDAYAKALQLDSSRKPENPKLTTINSINTAPPQAPVMALPPSELPLSNLQEPAPSTAPEPQIAVAPPVRSAPAEPPTAAVNAPTTVSPAPATRPTESETVASAPPTAASSQSMSNSKDDMDVAAADSVEKALATWAKAWEQQNMEGYYAAYSKRFSPNGTSLSAWKAERKSRIVGKPGISIDISNLQVRVNGDRATARFRQQYKSGNFRSTTRKTLEMQNEGGKWRILRENTGR